MTRGDYIYASFVIFGVVVWFVGTVLWIDKKLRERRWRKRDEARPKYVDLTLLQGFGPTTNETVDA